MKPRRTVIAVCGGMFVLAAASMLDAARVSSSTVASRGDRLDISEQAARCGLSSVIAACADPAAAGETKSASMIQVFEKPGETILVRVKLGE
jgi:hypothetical protein